MTDPKSPPDSPRNRRNAQYPPPQKKGGIARVHIDTSEALQIGIPAEIGQAEHRKAMIDIIKTTAQAKKPSAEKLLTYLRLLEKNTALKQAYGEQILAARVAVEAVLSRDWKDISPLANDHWIIRPMIAAIV